MLSHYCVRDRSRTCCYVVNTKTFETQRRQDAKDILSFSNLASWRLCVEKILVFLVTPWLRGRRDGSAEVEFQADGVAFAGPVDAVLQGLVVGEIEEPEIVVALRQDLRGVFVGREDLAGR